MTGVAYALSRKNRVQKRRLYARAGIARNIPVDAAARKQTIYSDPDAKQGSYRHTPTLDAERDVEITSPKSSAERVATTPAH